MSSQVSLSPVLWSVVSRTLVQARTPTVLLATGSLLAQCGRLLLDALEGKEQFCPFS